MGNVSVCSEAILGLVELCGPTFGNLTQPAQNMAVNLSKNGSELMAAYGEVVDCRSNTNW